MVPYTGKNSSKQTIRTKKIRFGYKNFVICSDDSYPYFIDPYCGSKYGDGKARKNLTAWSVIDSILEIDNWDDKDVYFDNWFTSLFLISILKAWSESNRNSQSRSSWKRFENQQKRHQMQRTRSYVSVLREKWYILCDME